MGKLMVAAVRVLSLCAVLLVLPTVAAAPSGFFKVESTKGWQTSSIFVQQGQKLSVVAMGTWTVDFRYFPYVSPDGYSADVGRTIFQGCKLDSILPYAILLVRIGDDDPSCMVIGSGGTFTAYKAGELQFRIHDADACQADNDALVLLC